MKSKKQSDLPLSPFSPALEGFQIILLAGAAGKSAEGIAKALEHPLQDKVDIDDWIRKKAK